MSEDKKVEDISGAMAGPDKVKTESELLAERLERYKADPNTFIELDEIVICALKSAKSQLGVSVMTGNVSRGTLDIGQTELNHQINKIRMQMDMQSEMARQPKIQQSGGFLNGIRNLKK